MNEESQLKVQQRPHQNFKVTYVQLTAIGHKATGYFTQLLYSQNRVKLCFQKVLFCQKPQESSYIVTELIAQKKKSPTAGEKLIMSACKIIVSKMFRQDGV